MGKLSSLAYSTRPDICFDVKTLSNKFNKATKRDLQMAMKRMMKVKSEQVSLKYSNIGKDLRDWVLVGHGDAGIRSMADKVTSVGGYVILLCNAATNACCVLGWKSKKIKRKVISSLAGEALAMISMIGELVYTKAILEQIFGERVRTIPTIVMTDSKNLAEAIKSSSLVEDSWLIPDIAVIKEALENRTVTEVRRIPGSEMLADCLTKKGASGAALLEVLNSGVYIIPSGSEKSNDDPTPETTEERKNTKTSLLEPISN